MFRFSIRDLFWLTLVVALALGWFVHQRQLRDKADRADNQATKWRLVAGGFEDYFTQIGWYVKWDWVSSQIVIDSTGSTRLIISTNSHEPTGPDPD